MTAALTRMLTSMKVWTAIIGLTLTAGGTWLAKHGLEVSDATAVQVAITISGIFAVLLHAQGQADLGKNAAPPQNIAAGNDVTVAPTKPPEGGAT